MENIIIKDAKKLNARITSVTGSLKKQMESIQPLIASAVWRTIAHTDDSCLNRLIENLPTRYQAHAVSYAVAFAPVVQTGKDDIHPIKMKKGTSPDLKKADNTAGNLPNWLEWSKEKKESEYDAAKAISTFFSNMKKKLENGKVVDSHAAIVEALLSFESNIIAGIPREKMLADAIIASQVSPNFGDTKAENKQSA